MSDPSRDIAQQLYRTFVDLEHAARDGGDDLVRKLARQGREIAQQAQQRMMRQDAAVARLDERVRCLQHEVGLFR